MLAFVSTIRQDYSFSVDVISDRNITNNKIEKILSFMEKRIIITSNRICYKRETSSIL